MRKTILAAIIMVVWSLAGCSGTTNNPSSEVGNPNPNGGVELEPLRNISLGGGYELRIREEWQASDVGGAVAVSDADGSLRFTAGLTDDPATRAEFYRCPSTLVSMAWASGGTVICDLGGRLIVGRKDAAVAAGTDPLVVIALQAGVGTDDFSVATTGQGAGAASATAAATAGSPSPGPAAQIIGSPDKCANAPAGTPGCDDGPIQVPGGTPATPADKVEGEGLLRDAGVTLTIPILNNAGDAGDSLCLFYLIDDPGEASLGDLQAQGKVKGRTCFAGSELQQGTATPAKPVAQANGSTLLADIHHILARAHNEGGAPFTITLQEVQAVSGSVTATFNGPPVPFLTFDEVFFQLHAGE